MRIQMDPLGWAWFLVLRSRLAEFKRSDLSTYSKFVLALSFFRPFQKTDLTLPSLYLQLDYMCILDILLILGSSTYKRVEPISISVLFSAWVGLSVTIRVITVLKKHVTFILFFSNCHLSRTTLLSSLSVWNSNSLIRGGLIWYLPIVALVATLSGGVLAGFFINMSGWLFAFHSSHLYHLPSHTDDLNVHSVFCLLPGVIVSLLHTIFIIF